MSQDHQRGTALLIALVVVALASVLGVMLVERSQSTLARAQAMSDRAQVDQLATGMALLAERGLAEALAAEARQGRKVDVSQWTPPYQVPGGMISGRLIDLGGRFNLNALFHPEPSKRAHARLVFQNLMQQLNLNTRLSNVWFDWLDGLGTQSRNPQAPSPAPLMHVSELREWPSMDDATYERLRPWLSVLPTPELMINVNEASPVVLAAAIFAMDRYQAERVLSDRPFDRQEDIWVHPILAQMNLGPMERSTLVVSSPWYLAQARVSLDDPEGVAQFEVFRLISARGSGYDFRYVSHGIP